MFYIQNYKEDFQGGQVLANSSLFYEKEKIIH